MAYTMCSRRISRRNRIVAASPNSSNALFFRDSFELALFSKAPNLMHSCSALQMALVWSAPHMAISLAHNSDTYARTYSAKVQRPRAGSFLQYCTSFPIYTTNPLNGLSANRVRLRWHQTDESARAATSIAINVGQNGCSTETNLIKTF